jgi:hypothetical protein
MGSIGMIRLQKVVAIVLGLSGVSAILYAGMLPLPPFSSKPVPLAGEVLGVMTLIAAVGIFRLQPWGRVLGIIVVAIGMALAVLRVVARAADADPMATVVSLVLGLAVDSIVLWVLLRYWPPKA